jgi:hypothetical protein
LAALNDCHGRCGRQSTDLVHFALAWMAEKYRRFDRGERMSPDWMSGLERLADS